MTTEVAQLMRVAESCLGAFLGRSGKILYSSSDTLQRGLPYILGLNPGGDPDRPEPSHYTIREAIQRLGTKTDNDFVDEVWQGARNAGSRRLQRRVQLICLKLGLRVEEVCAANLVFVRSRDQQGAGLPHMANVCWPVHEEILRVVQPAVVLTFGDAVFDYVCRRLSSTTDVAPVECFASGHGNRKCRQTRVTFQDWPIQLFHMPHLGRYDPQRGPWAIERMLRVLNDTQSRAQR